MTSQSFSSISTKEEQPDYKILYQELKSQHQFMLSQISHEIRNPVTLINSFLQLLENHHPELSLDAYWKKIMENMDFLISLLEDLSEFNNSVKLHMQEINLYHLFQDIIHSAEPVCQRLGISLILMKKTAVPTLQADRTKIRQLLLNLLRNAREAIGSQGIITCALASDGNTVTISIQDTGPGIPIDYQKDLFQPFITHKKEGTGLGLAICKRIAEAHEGSISFTSSPEEGTKFTIILPVK